MRYFIICDDSGNPIYCDHPEGMMTCLIFNGLDKFLTERDEHFSQKFKSMCCGGVLFVAQKYKNLSFLVVSDQGESEMYLRTLLRQIFEHMVMVFGPHVMLEGKYTSFTRHKKAIQHIIDTACVLGDRHQAMLVRATERLEVNDRTRGECFNALKNTVQNEKLITHALVFVGTKLLVSYTRAGKSQDIDPSDLLLLITDFHATFHPPNREVEEMELPIADYRDHSNITIRGAQPTPQDLDGPLDPLPSGEQLPQELKHEQLATPEATRRADSNGLLHLSMSPIEGSGGRQEEEEEGPDGHKNNSSNTGAHQDVLPEPSAPSRLPLPAPSRREASRGGGSSSSSSSSSSSDNVVLSSQDSARLNEAYGPPCSDGSSASPPGVAPHHHPPPPPPPHHHHPCAEPAGAESGGGGGGGGGAGALDGQGPEDDAPLLQSSPAMTSLLGPEARHPDALLQHVPDHPVSSFSSSSSSACGAEGEEEQEEETEEEGEGEEANGVSNDHGLGEAGGKVEGIPHAPSREASSEAGPLADEKGDAEAVGEQKEEEEQEEEEEEEEFLLRNDEEYDPTRLTKYKAMYLRTPRYAPFWVYFAELGRKTTLVMLTSNHQQTGAKGSVEERQELDRVRDTMRALLQSYSTYLITKEHTHLPILSFLHQFPGLVHFLFVDRTFNRVIAPSISALHTMNCPPGEDAERHMKRVIKRLVWDMCFESQQHLSEGAQSVLVKNGPWQYSYRLWVEDVDGFELIFPPEVPFATQHVPQTNKFYQKLMQRFFPTRGNLRCYELFTLYLGTLSVETVIHHNRELVNVLLNRSLK